MFTPPEQFLGTAEDTGLIVPLSEWILREACREVAEWRAASWDIGLSVNLSKRQIMAAGFVETVSEALSDSGLPPSALTLEVIEEMLVEDAEDTIGKLSDLRALGVRLAIDDFGTGYASLALLRQLPVDIIKIDPSFVSGLGRDETLSLLTRTIVRLGHDLGLIVVAEESNAPNSSTCCVRWAAAEVRATSWAARWPPRASIRSCGPASRRPHNGIRVSRI